MIKRCVLPLLFVSLASSAWAQTAFANQTPVSGTLKQGISSGRAQVGQAVMVTLDKKVAIGTVTLDKGTVLTGSVVDVSKHTKDSPKGSLTLVFDHAKPKKGDVIEIKASIYRIEPSEGQAQAQRTEGDISGGMRGTAGATASAAAARGATDQTGRSVQGMTSAAGAPVQVVSAIPGVALSAVASDGKSGVMVSPNADVELMAGTEFTIGVELKQ